MTENHQTTKGKPQPVEKISMGSIKATIWANTGADGRTNHVITLPKSYKDQEGNWRETTSYFLEDLPKIAVAAMRAYESLLAKSHQKSADESQGHAERIGAEAKSNRTRRGG